MLYSVVIPCYRSDKTIRKVVELTMKQFHEMHIDEYESGRLNSRKIPGSTTR